MVTSSRRRRDRTSEAVRRQVLGKGEQNSEYERAYCDGVLRRLQQTDWRAWADACRRAVACDPDAFSATPDELDRLTDAAWQQYARRYCTPSSAGFVCERERTFVAAVGVETSGDAAVVTSLWVSPDWRRRGIGRALMAAAEKWAVDHSVTTLFLTVGPGLDAAVALYRSVGFSTTNAAETGFAKALADPSIHNANP